MLAIRSSQDARRLRPAGRPRRRAAGRTRYASNGVLRIAYEPRGTMHRRRPWLILIHGMAFDRSGWGPVLQKLGHRFRLVLVDNRGTGHTDRPTGSVTPADIPRDADPPLRAVGVRRA